MTLGASRSEVPQLAIIFRCSILGEQFIGLEKTSKACTAGLNRSVDLYILVVIQDNAAGCTWYYY
eukprot:COSAG05_NODE_2572_length_2885_cov_2.493180_1_plen_65_part_00